MERNRLRRSKSAATIEGGKSQNIQRKPVSKQSLDSCLFSDGFANGNEFGSKSYNGAGGKPIKKLLAEELTQECEPKKRSPSIIARLMGLEGLPSPQHGHKQQRKASDKRHQHNASVGIHQTPQSVKESDGCQHNASVGIHQTPQSVKDHSSRSSVDQLEFKDVHEDLEASNISNRRYSSAWVSDPQLKKSAPEQVQQKNKHILSSGRVPVSFELPDSVFIEQFHDISSSNSLHGHGVSLEPSNLVEHEDNAKLWEQERGNECRFDVSSRRKREDGLLLLLNNRHKSCHPLENRFNVKIEKDVLPTKIVLLKPNLGKASNSNALVTSPSSPHTTHSSSFKKHLVCRKGKAGEAEKRTKRNLSSGLSFSKGRCGKDRVLARAITRHMRESLGTFGHDLTFSARSGVRGYAGDESSSDLCESDSSSGVEGMNISSRNSIDGSNCFRSSPSGLESSKSTDAKKHLSERWKTSQRCQDSQPIGKISTLGEMLAVSNRIAKHEHLDAVGKKVCRTEASFGSSYSWKDGDIRNSSRSRPLPRYSSGSRVHKTIEINEPPINDLIPTEKKNGGRSKSRKGNLGQNEDNAVKFIKTNSRKAYNNYRKFNDRSNTLLDPSFDEVESEIILNKQAEVEKQFLQSGGSVNILEDHNSCADDPNAALKEPSVFQSDEGSTSLLWTERDAVPECSENSKETDRHSPVSVLGVSFSEEQSSISADCFETVNAELHELRMQLQLLKMESGNYDEAPELVSNDEAESVFHEKRFFNENSWKYSYMEDVLINSGLETVNEEDAFLAAWHSPNCPLNPWIFDIVEKKYRDDDVTVTKLERKLLFDLMNSALVEAFKELVDPCPWVRSVCGGFSLKWRSECIRDALHKFLVKVEEEGCGRKRKGKELDREMNWLRVEECIEVIGKEIEEMLVGDIVGEVILALDFDVLSYTYL